MCSRPRARRTRSGSGSHPRTCSLTGAEVRPHPVARSHPRCCTWAQPLARPRGPWLRRSRPRLIRLVRASVLPSLLCLSAMAGGTPIGATFTSAMGLDTREILGSSVSLAASRFRGSAGYANIARRLNIFGNTYSTLCVSPLLSPPLASPDLLSPPGPWLRLIHSPPIRVSTDLCYAFGSLRVLAAGKQRLPAAQFVVQSQSAISFRRPLAA